jgi:hypothetical protein
MDEPNWPSNEAVEELRKKINSPREKYVFVRMDMNADSYNGMPRMLSIHETLEGAIDAIPKNIRQGYPNRQCFSDYVANFAYEAVRKVRLER